MCSKETRDEALEGIDITKKAISFLQDRNEMKKLFTNVEVELFSKKNDEFYIIQLKENLAKFKNSILGNKGHLKFIEKKLIQRKKAIFKEYNEDANELKKLKKAYCAFYTIASKYIQTTNDDKLNHQKIKDVIIESFKALAKFYCPQEKMSSS